jgi:hypothetical protein
MISAITFVHLRPSTVVPFIGAPDHRPPLPSSQILREALSAEGLAAADLLSVALGKGVVISRHGLRLVYLHEACPHARLGYRLVVGAQAGGSPRRP